MERSNLTGLSTSALLLVLLLSHRASCVETIVASAEAPCKLGDCISASSCPIIRPAIDFDILSGSQSRSDRTRVIDIMKQHSCGPRKSRRVCCTDLAADLIQNNILTEFADESSTLALAEFVVRPCGESNDAVSLFEFPWMALLEFNTTRGRGFMCAGSLISDRYVLAPAHCLYLPETQLVSVRLGEYDASTEIDCDRVDEVEECAPPVQDHQVEDIIIRGDFNNERQENDIALIHLKNRVTFGDRIFPVCLPIMRLFARDYTNGKLAGWGLRDGEEDANSTVLEAIDLSTVPKEVCEEQFGRNLSSTHICAAGATEPNICVGGSGGPLFNRPMGAYGYVQYGLLTTSSTTCGEKGKAAGIYTNIVEYVPWILKNMRN